MGKANLCDLGLLGMHSPFFSPNSSTLIFLWGTPFSTHVVDLSNLSEGWGLMSSQC